MKNIKALINSFLVAIILSIGFAGCGGGDDSSSAALSFPSNSVSAEPTIENGQKVKEVVAVNQQSAYSLNSVHSSSHKNIAIVMKQIGNRVKKNNNFYSLNETFSETQSCSNAGEVSTSGSGNDTDGAMVTTTFDSCDENGIFMNGKIVTTLSNYNSTIGSYTKIDMTFTTDLLVTGEGSTTKILQGSKTIIEMNSFSSFGIPLNMIMTIDAISEIGAIKTGQQSAVYYFDLSSLSTPSMYQTSGRVYIDNLASYVDYDISYNMSQTPFVFAYDGLESGEARYTMLDGAKVKIVVEENEVKTYVDADGDGIYELSE